MGERYSWKEGTQENYQRVVQDRNLSVEEFLQKAEYIQERDKICWRNFRFFNRDPAFDIDDLIQAANIKVVEIANRYPDKLAIMPYVKKAIQNAMFGLMRKRKRTLGEVCLVHEYDDGVPGPNLVVPTRDRDIERASAIDDLIYQIGEEFGSQAAENMKVFIDRCSDVYNLHLSEPPSTETKDRIKVVTAMDLSDEELFVYAQVLLGAREWFPDGYLRHPRSKDRAVKYIQTLFQALSLSPRKFARSSESKRAFFCKYKLEGFFQVQYQHKVFALLQDIFPDINEEDVYGTHKWNTDIPLERISKKIREFVKSKNTEPSKIRFNDFIEAGLQAILVNVFGGSPRLAIECAYPGTYPLYSELVQRIKDRRGGTMPFIRTGGRRGFRGHASPRDYYLAHEKEFIGLSRTELNQHDQPLYRALLSNGELDEVLPEGRLIRWAKVSGEDIAKKISILAKNLRKKPENLTLVDYLSHGLEGMLKSVFDGKSRFATEFVFPGTYPKYSKEAKRLRKKYRLK